MAAVRRVRERLIAQRTMACPWHEQGLINTLRGHVAECGGVAGKGPGHVKELRERLAEPGAVPEMLRSVLLGLASVLAALERQIAAVERRRLGWHRGNALSRRLATIPGLGPITSSALAPNQLPAGAGGSLIGAPAARREACQEACQEEGATGCLQAIDKMGKTWPEHRTTIPRT